MKANSMRAPLIKSAVVLLLLIVWISLIIKFPDIGPIYAAGYLIKGIFQLAMWAIAMVIGLCVSIAFLIGVFLFASYLVDKKSAAELYKKTKQSLVGLVAPMLSSASGKMQCAESSCGCASEQVQAPQISAEQQLKEELQGVIVSEMKKVAASQEALNNQFSALGEKLQTLEAQNADFAAADQVTTLAKEIAESGKLLTNVQESLKTLEGKLGETVKKFDALSPDKILGEIPSRLEKVEQGQENREEFDPTPLTQSIEKVQAELAETSKKIEALTPTALLGEIPSRLEKIEQGLNKEEFDPAPMLAAVEQLQAKLQETVAHVEALTPEKLLGELPARLEKLEQSEGDATPGEAFDPTALNESIAALQAEVEELKKKKTTTTRKRTTTRSTTRAKKKA